MSGRFLHYSEVLLRIMPEQDYAARLEALAEALPLEVAATDAEGRIVVWNAALARTAGPRSHAVGRHLLEAMPWLLEDPNVDWRAWMSDILNGDAGRSLPRHPLGRRVVRATMAPMVGAMGVRLGVVLCFEDITHPARVEERRRLQARSEAVAALGAGIAHEIRNPLNALSLNLQLLREKLADPHVSCADLVAKADAMVDEAARMEALIQNLLEVVRGGEPIFADERIDEIVASVVSRLMPESEAKAVTIRVSRGSSRILPLERTRIEAAVRNIVENAVDAAGRGGNVWIATRDDPHSTVVVVDDDGDGIRPEERGHVFELFWTNKRGGTGLGLPLARRAVESHGGELEVLERPGGGARFVIHLPIKAGQDLREDVREDVGETGGNYAWLGS